MATRALFDPELLPTGWFDPQLSLDLAWFDDSFALVAFEGGFGVARAEFNPAGAALVQYPAAFAGSAALAPVGSYYNAYPKTAAEMATAVGWGTWKAGYLLDEAATPLKATFGGTSDLTSTGITTPTFGSAGAVAGDRAVTFTTQTCRVAAQTASDFDVNATSDMALCLICKVTDISVGGAFMSKGDTGSAPYIFMDHDAGAQSGTLIVNDAGGSFTFGYTIAPQSEWMVFLAVVDRSVNQMRVGVYGLSSGLFAASAATDVSTMGSLANPTKPFTLSDNDLIDPGSIFAASALYIATGAGAATGMSANIDTAVTNLFNYITRSIGDGRAVGSSSFAAVGSTGSGTTDGDGAFAGTSTVSPVGASAATAAAAATGSASLAATGASSATTTSTIAGVATFGAAGTAVTTGAASSSGVASFAAVGASAAAAAASVTGTATEAAVGASAAAASSSVAGTSSVAAVGAGAAAASSAIAGTASLSAVPLVTAAFAGSSSLAPVGASQATTSSAIAGTSTVAGVGASAATASSSIAGTTTVGATGASTAEASATITGAAALAAVGSSGGGSNAAVFVGTGTLAAVGAAFIPAVASIAGTSSVAAVGASTFSASTALAGTSTAAATGISAAAASASSAGSATVSAAGSSTATAAAAIAGTSALAAISPTIVTASASFSGSSSFAAAGGALVTSSTAIAGTSTVTPVPEVHGTITGASSFAAVGASAARASTGIAGTSSLVARTDVFATFSGGSNFTVFGTGIKFSTLTITCSSTITVPSAALARAVATFAGVGVLAVTAAPNLTAGLSEDVQIDAVFAEAQPLDAVLDEHPSFLALIDPL